VHKFSIVGCGLLALVSVAHAESGAKEPPQLKLECGQFTPLPNGYWASGPDAKVKVKA